MALTVETGAGLSGADAYISVADHTAYLSAWFPDEAVAWQSTLPATKEAYIRRATLFVDRFRFRGVPSLHDQALSWPRDTVIDADGRERDEREVPEEVKRATSEAVRILAAGGDLAPSLARGRQVKQKTIGPITTIYDDGAESRSVYTQVTDHLAPLLANGRRAVRM